jgi:poly(3-hydroxybutyrate) depolymerase
MRGALALIALAPAAMAANACRNSKPASSASASASPSPSPAPTTLASSGCRATALPSGIERGALSSTQTVNGREYKVYVPPSYSPSSSSDSSDDAPLPLILSFHGAGGTAASQAGLDLLTDLQFGGASYIIAYLQGTADDPSDPGHTTWEGAPGNTSDDLAFAADVLDAVEAALCVDRARVFATGKSQGGGFVNRLACDGTLSQRIAAFAPVAGAYYVDGVGEAECGARPVDGLDLDATCAPGRARIPLLAFHGGTDDIINIAGGWRAGKCLPAVRSWVEQWVARSGLDVVGDEDSGSPEGIPDSENGNTTSWGGGLVRFVYAGDEVGHDWPAAVWNKDNGDGVRAAFNATPWILGFFEAHALEA